jgi:hypothetical protein
MKIDLNSIEFSDDDIDSLHDVIINALDDKDDLTRVEILEYWKKFPDDIKLDALKWGVSDSVVGDNMYVWLQKNC